MIVLDTLMPKSCGECRASGTDVCRKWMGKKNLKVRSEDCLIKGEIPDKHGRLIDADSLKKTLSAVSGEQRQWFYAEVGQFIDEAPTVVEATE